MAVKLDKVIYVQILNKENNKKTKNGFYEPEWEDKYKLFASANNLFGKEYWSAKAVQSEKTVEFTVRYSSVIENLDTDSSRIKFNNKIYDIQMIDNPKYANIWLKIKAMIHE